MNAIVTEQRARSPLFRLGIPRFSVLKARRRIAFDKTDVVDNKRILTKTCREKSFKVRFWKISTLSFCCLK